MKELGFNCPHCEQRIECDVAYAGMEIDCPSCQKQFMVPALVRAPIPRWFVPSLVMLAGICLLIFPRLSQRFVAFLLPPSEEDFNRLIAFMTGAALVALWGVVSLIWSFTPKGKWGKIKFTLQLMTIVLLAGSAIFIIRWKFKFRAEEEAKQREFIHDLNPEKFESSFETKVRYEKEAESYLVKECTNYLGFSRILDHYLYTSDETVTNWHGEATIDFINHNGGIDRTNLLFFCQIVDHHCYASIDEGAMYKRQRDEEERSAAFRRSIESQ